MAAMHPTVSDLLGLRGPRPPCPCKLAGGRGAGNGASKIPSRPHQQKVKQKMIFIRFLPLDEKNRKNEFQRVTRS